MTFCNMHNLRELGLIAWYPMAASTMYDLSGNGLNGTPAPGTGLTKSPDGWYQYTFSGTGHVDIASSSLFDTQEKTISLWTRVYNWAGNGFWFEKTVGGTVNTGYSIFYNTNNIIARCYIPLSGSADLTVAAPDIINRWFHLVYTWDGATRSYMYYNAVQVGTMAHTQAHATGAGVSIVGTYGGGAGYPLQGDMRNLMIFNKALTQGQINAIYNEQYIK